MPQSTKLPAVPKDCPVRVHRNGQFYKRVRGKFYYLGRDLDEALRLWATQKDRMFAGLPIVRDGDVTGTLEEVCNHFLSAKEKSNISSRHFQDLQKACQYLCDAMGKTAMVESMTMKDFERLRGEIVSKYNPTSSKNLLTKIRSVFKYAEEMLDIRIKYRSPLASPSRGEIRRDRAAKRVAHGKRMFTPDQLRLVLESTDIHFKAIILLCANCGLNGMDIAMMTTHVLDLDAGWLDYPRTKSGVDRRVPLWPETVKAVRQSIKWRPKHKKQADSQIVFLNQRGARWVKGNGQTAGLSEKMKRLLRKLKLYRPGLDMGALRHTFQTVGDEASPLATRAIMGHVDGSMSGNYRESISDEKLRLVTDHIRQWLFGGEVSV